MPATRNARGYEEPNGQVQIAVRIPKALFDEMKSFAVKSNTSIAARIRDYIQVGVEVDRDMEEDASA
jgi:hypothetical protein